MSNRATLDDFQAMAPADVDALPNDQLHMLWEDAKAETARIKAVGDKINASLLDRYSGKADALRQAKSATGGGDGKTGSVTIKDAGAAIKLDVPKKVEWDQAKLAELCVVIKDGWKENPAEFIDVEYKVSETKYKAWPKSIRDHFEPARTFSAGKQSIKIERKDSN